ncbi:hypothetical protein [Microbulbifer sp. TRSA007]|uniref:hypothetical protein n=1 Tax=Microbulbifer sp. TRSA007 TaxID=3243384 RepID=UPI00403964E8
MKAINSLTSTGQMVTTDLEGVTSQLASRKFNKLISSLLLLRATMLDVKSDQIVPFKDWFEV